MTTKGAGVGLRSVAGRRSPELGGDPVITEARERRVVLAAMCIALVAVVASVSGLNVAQEALAVDLGATQSQVLWIINGYTLVLAALLLPVGAIGDRWGRKPILLIGLAGFAVTNFASAFATGPGVLIALRVLAGVAAAMVMPVTLSVITTSFPPAERAKAVGTWAGFAGAGGVMGLFASAFVVDNTTWPWVFAVPVLLTCAAFALTAVHLPHSVEHADAGFDFVGSALSFTGVGGLVLACHEGPDLGWTSPVAVASLAAGVLAAGLFVLAELRHDHPLLDVRMFADRRLATGSVNLFVVFAAMFSLFLLLVQYLQVVFGYSALQSAAGVVPLALVMMPISVVAPMLAERLGVRRVLVAGMLSMALGFAIFLELTDASSGYLSVLPGTLVLGVGAGLAMSPSTTAITSALPPDKQGVASSLNDTVREMGGAVGIALIGSVLNAGYRSNVAPATTALPPELAATVKQGIGGALVVAARLGPDGTELVGAARKAFVDGMTPALQLAIGLTLGAAAYTAWRGPDRPTDGADG